MPTRIHTRRRAKAVPGEDLDLQSYTIIPPWLGYCPDLNPSLVTFAAFESCQGLVNEDGELTLDNGWVRLEDNTDPITLTLPLGGENTPPNAPLAPAGAGYEQPVVLIAELARSDGAVNRLNMFAATCVTPWPIAGPPASATIGFCWWLNPANDQWTNVPFAGAGTAITDGEWSDPFDWTYWPRGGTAFPNQINPGAIYFTNYEDAVYVWDIGNGGVVPGNYLRAFPQLGGQDFHANSVETFWERLVFLNTQEGDGLGNLIPYTRRVRWTDAANTPVLVGAGAGALDFDELTGLGLRVLAFEDVCACYFEDGVGVLRRIGLTNNPFKREYYSKERGLLGKFAVCRISGDRHFGVFTDGFFFLNSNGVWTEAGALNTNLGVVRKWTRTFFRTVNADLKDQIKVNYDEYTSRVHITFPLATESQEPETNFSTWIYDLHTDTMWPDEAYAPTCWGQGAAILANAIEWGDAPGTWAGQGDLTWGDFGTIYGDRATLHGTVDGLIFFHTPALFTRDGEEVSWNLYSHLQSLEDPHTVKATDRLLVEHNQVSDPKNIAVGFRNDEHDTDLDTIALDVGVGGTKVVTVAHARINGYSIGTVASGTGPIRLWSFQATFRPSGIPNKGVG